MMNISEAKIFVAGSTGMVGRAIVRALGDAGCKNLLTISSSDLDLRNQAATRTFFASRLPEIVVLAAAKVGGIAANNDFRGAFIYDNLIIEANVTKAALDHGVHKLIFLGSSCIYPKFASQPIVEEELLTGLLEPTNEPYAIAKIAGIKLCENFHRQYGANFYSVMPTNLYGPYDNFDPSTSHVVPALMRRIHEAKDNGEPEVAVWGTGTPRREFLHVDDLARAVTMLTTRVDAADIYGLGVSHVNIGSGEDLSVSELASLIAEVIGYRGKLVFDATKPDGTPQKLLDTTRINKLGWQASTPLRAGLESTYRWFCEGD